MEELKEIFQDWGSIFSNECERPHVSSIDEEQFLKDTI